MPWPDGLSNLGMIHHQFPGSSKWCLTRNGIGIDGADPLGTPGEPVSCRRVWSWWASDITAAARRYRVPVELIVALILVESAGGKTSAEDVRRSRREEPGYVSDEATPARVSVGCMQTLLATARDALGDATLTAADLETSTVSIAAGAAYVGHAWDASRFDPPRVAAAYNAGGLYSEQLVGNRWRMRCYPLGTGAYIDRFVPWFNDCMAVGAESDYARGAPSFVTSIPV